MQGLTSIRTPTLILEPEVCKRNIVQMHDKMTAHGIMFRPHFKTHQSHQIGRWFRDIGVQRITVSSFQMADYFARDGWQDITVAFPVNLLEIDLIRKLAESIKLNILAESPEVIKSIDKQIGSEVGVFLKIDVGTHRTGISSDDQPLLESSIRALQTSRHCMWTGVLAHAGHTYKVRQNPGAVQDIYRLSSTMLSGVLDKYGGGFDGLIVSFGDTPGASMVDDFSGIDEMRPGNFVFYDYMQYQIGSCRLDDVAVQMYCPVVASHGSRRECVIYGGAIHFSKEGIDTRRSTVSFGEAFRVADNSADEKLGYVRSLSQEHGVIVLDPRVEPPVAGDLVRIIPVHSCLTAQCMGRYSDRQGGSYDHFAGWQLTQ